MKIRHSISALSLMALLAPFSRAATTVNCTVSAGECGAKKNFSGVNALNYNIFWSTGYNQIIGDGSGASVAGSVGPFRVAAGSSNVVTETFYGLIPASQDVAMGAVLNP
jgi:spore coat protein U-like protein